MKVQNNFPVMQNSMYGLVDQQGHAITDFKYISISAIAEDFSIGLFHEQGELINEIIDVSGNIVHRTKDIIKNFSENLALSLDHKHNKYGFIDPSGKYIIPPIFDYENKDGVYYSNPIGFSEHKTFVLFNKEITAINQEGDILFTDQNYQEAYRFCNNIAVVEDLDRNYFFISVENKKLDILPKGFNIKGSISKNFWGFRNGFCRVFKNGKTTFINTNGELIFPDKQFTSASDIHEQISVVTQEEKYGVINLNGEFIIDPVYDFIGNFNHGIAPYQVNKIWGLIDNIGNIVYEANIKSETVFDKIENFGMRYSTDPFHNIEYSNLTRALIKKQNGKFQKNKEVYINRLGEITFEFQR